MVVDNTALQVLASTCRVVYILFRSFLLEDVDQMQPEYRIQREHAIVRGAVYIYMRVFYFCSGCWIAAKVAGSRLITITE